jgi:hypothetical protein
VLIHLFVLAICDTKGKGKGKGKGRGKGKGVPVLQLSTMP